MLLILTSASAQQSVVIGCFDANGINAYPQAQLNTIVSLFINDGASISNASITTTDNGTFYISAIHTKSGVVSSIGINLEIDGNSILITGGSCAQKCTPNDGCSCKLTIVIPCQEIISTCTSGFGGCGAEITISTSLSAALISFINSIGTPPGC